MLCAKPGSTQSDPSTKLHKDAGTPHLDIHAYKRLVGRLLYLNATRLDITLCTQQLSQFLYALSVNHFNAATYVLRYLKSCPGRGIFLPRDSQLKLQGYSYADFGGCSDTKRSTFGQCLFLGRSLISWRIKKQLTVPRSSNEVECRALDTATCELQWIAYLFKYLKVECLKIPVLYCDNQSALTIAANPVFHERTKHLAIDCHIVKEKMLNGLMKLLPYYKREDVEWIDETTAMFFKG
ncbi:hypothetical protein KIW84_060751 [Lathyrus oleraceus]|uniref:Uncharacterized protein n=1 Tax=Pisum sativum TaxID=3888 RepID=A0A9D4W3R8_PEA|nr:hypothetical protein KIW84_060751 [Pisum sativum]